MESLTPQSHLTPASFLHSFSCCFLLSHRKMKGQQMATGWPGENPVGMAAPSRQLQLVHLPTGAAWPLAKESLAIFLGSISS